MAYLKNTTSSTYADYLRRIDNWLNSFSHSTRSDNNESVHFLRLDAHEISSNPFYMPLKTRSFKSIQMTMHFYLMDLLRKNPQGCTKQKIISSLNNDYFYRDVIFKDFNPNEPEKMLQQYVEQRLLNYYQDNKTYSFAETSLFLTILEPKTKYTLESLMDENMFLCFYQDHNPDSIAAELSTISNIIEFDNGYYYCNSEQPISLFCEKKILIGNKTKFVPKRYTKQEMLNILTAIHLDTFPISKITDDQLRYFLDEYEKLGLIKTTFQKPKTYILNDNIPLTGNMISAIQYFSEIGNVGFLGSTLLDLQDEEQDSPFLFKHHYIAQAINTEIVYQLLEAIHYHNLIKLNLCNPNNNFKVKKKEIVLPLKIYRSTDSGRTYLLAYYCSKQRYDFFMLDNIDSMNEITSLPAKENLAKVVADLQKQNEKKVLHCTNFDEILDESDNFTKYIWSMSTTLHQDDYPKPTSIKVIFHVGSNEGYIKRRLEREKRQGQLTFDDKTQTATFSIQLFNPGEMFPWLRSYITRIKSISFENKSIEQKFLSDIQCMNYMYDIHREEEKNV